MGQLPDFLKTKKKSITLATVAVRDGRPNPNYMLNLVTSLIKLQIYRLYNIYSI